MASPRRKKFNEGPFTRIENNVIKITWRKFFGAPEYSSEAS